MIVVIIFHVAKVGKTVIFLKYVQGDHITWVCLMCLSFFTLNSQFTKGAIVVNGANFIISRPKMYFLGGGVDRSV